MTLQIETVNKKLIELGFDEQLRKGVGGYFYFTGGTSHLWKSTCVYAFTVNELSLQEWVDKCVELKSTYTKRKSPEAVAMEVSFLEFLSAAIDDSTCTMKVIVPVDGWANRDTGTDVITYIDPYQLKLRIDNKLLDLTDS